MGYQPSKVAQALRTGRFQVLGMMVPANRADWAPLLLGASREAAERGYHMLVCPVGPDTPLERQADGLSVDGFLAVWTERDDATVPPLPVVFVDRKPTAAGDIVMRPDEFDAGVMACHHLLDQGCRSIALILPAAASDAVTQRLSGCREALRQQGMRPVAEVVHPAPERTQPTTSAVQPVAALVSLIGAGTGIDGVVAMDAGLGAAALSSLHAAGLRLPDQVSLIAFETDDRAELADPPMSTVGVPQFEVGAQAVAQLVQLVEGRAESARVHLVAPALRVRASSASTAAQTRARTNRG
jgi:DNA-binding LacI/PurR family transcriptional regulator